MIVKGELVDEADFTGEVGHMMTVNPTLKKALIAIIKVATEAILRRK